MKNKIYILLVFSILFYNCSNTKEEEFLENFKEVEKIDYSSNIGLKKQIINDDLYILTKSEAVNEFEFDTDKKYYYGCKTKINDDSYLIFYNCQYHIDNTYHPFALGVANKSYLCIYQKGIGIVSKLKIATDDPNWSKYEEKQNIHIIKSISSMLRYEEQKNGYYPYIAKDTIVSKYKIENNRFVKIK